MKIAGDYKFGRGMSDERARRPRRMTDEDVICFGTGPSLILMFVGSSMDEAR